MGIGTFSFLSVCFALLLSLIASSAYAIPAFTRQYKTECSTCHTIFPELNETGDAFYKNSFVLTGSNAPSSKKGAPRKESANEAAVLSSIPEVLPISFSAGQNFVYDPDAVDPYDFNTRFFTLHAGGSFRDKAGFFATYFAYSQGAYEPTRSNTPGNNQPNIGELFLQWRHAFDTPLNIKIGRFEPKLSLWKSTDRATPTFLAPLHYTVGNSRFSVDSTGDAVEGNAVIGNRLFIAGGVVDRNGQDTKEGYGHVSVKIGGTDFLGYEPEVDFDSDSIWDYLSITLGGYAYFGRNGLVQEGKAISKNDFYRAGADIDILYKRFRLKGSGVKGKDSNPLLTVVDSEDQDSLVLASEAEVLIGSSIIAAARYEYQDDETAVIRRYIPALTFAPLQNTKLQLEYKYEEITDTPVSDKEINRTGQFNVIFAF